MDWPCDPQKRGIPSEKPASHVVLAPHVLSRRNTSRARLSARPSMRHLLAIFALFAITAPARAQDIPAPDAAMAAYQTLDAWIRAWNVPQDAQQIDPPGAHASQVTLRLGGKVIGRGSLVGDDRTTLWHAARAAWREAESGLGVEKDALRAERTLEAAKRITIDVEFAGTLNPLLGATWAEASEHISPGIEGVAARVGNDIDAVFPGDMIATGLLPGRALQICTGRLRLPPLELGQLREKQSLVVYRFQGLHLAQIRSGAEPTFLTRGGKLAPDSETSGPGLRALAERISQHLLTHKWPGTEPHGLTGPYFPLTDTYEPMLASPREQGVVAFALCRYSTTPGIDAAPRAAALAFARSIVDQLAQVGKDETDPLATPVDAAAWLIAEQALHEADPRAPRAHPDFALRASGVLMKHWQDPPAWSASASAARAFIVYAMACVGQASPDASDLRAAAFEGVRGLYRDTDAAEIVALMPWLGWAELTLAEGNTSVPSADALRDLRSRLWQSQLQSADLDAFERDLEGGIVFTRGTTPLPTWQSLRPLTFLATMIGDARLTAPADVTAEVAALRRSLRFVRQLTIDEPAAWAARDPSRAIGGVRPALWTPSASLDASSLALLCVTETLRSISQRASVSIPPKGPMGRPQPEIPTGISR